MKQASFYGSCLNLLSDLQTCQHEEQLANMIFNFMSQHGLSSALCFHSEDELVSFDQMTEICSPIEHKVFSLLKEKGRIYEFGNRAMFNDSQVSLLVKNMPEKGGTLHGLLIDVLAKLITSINAHYLSVVHKRQLIDAQFSLDVIINEVEKGIKELSIERGRIVHSLISDISTSFHELGFDETQEKFLVSRIQATVKEQKSGDHRFVNIAETINTLKQLIMVNETTEVAVVEATDDVELF
jgi:hypothetical protein